MVERGLTSAAKILHWPDREQESCSIPFPRNSPLCLQYVIADQFVTQCGGARNGKIRCGNHYYFLIREHHDFVSTGSVHPQEGQVRSSQGKEFIGGDFTSILWSDDSRFAKRRVADPTYSCRSARIGSTCAARRAGMYVAAIATRRMVISTTT